MLINKLKRHFLFITGIFITSLLPLYSFLLFHIVAEFYSIIIAVTIFVIVINLKDQIEHGYLKLIGISYLYVGTIDFFHTLAYKDMNIFTGFDTNLATQLWISARYMESISLLIAIYFIDKKINLNKINFIYFLITILLFLSIFVLRVFPDCYIEGRGLTLFKIYSEYVICLILIISLLNIRKHKDQFSSETLSYIRWGIITTIFAEISFTQYVSVYGLFIFIGHIFKIISFYFIYLAIIKTALKEPFNLLWLKLKEAYIKLNTYIELLDLVFVVVDRDKNIVFINENGAKKLGYKKEELIGKNWIETIIVDDEKESTKTTFDKMITDELQVSNSFECNVLTKDRTQRIFAWHSTVLKDANGEIIAIVCAGEDISERKINEENREKLIKELEASLKKIRKLEGLIPVCASCKKIRTDAGYWIMVETYLQEISGLEISHGMCPACYEKAKNEIEELKKTLK